MRIAVLSGRLTLHYIGMSVTSTVERAEANRSLSARTEEYLVAAWCTLLEGKGMLVGSQVGRSDVGIYEVEVVGRDPHHLAMLGMVTQILGL